MDLDATTAAAAQVLVRVAVAAHRAWAVSEAVVAAVVAAVAAAAVVAAAVDAAAAVVAEGGDEQ